MSKPNYYEMYIESLRDCKDSIIIVYADSIVQKESINKVFLKMLNSIKYKYRRITIYSSIDLNIDGFTCIKDVRPIKDLLSSFCYREHSKFIGFMKTNSFLYDELIAYLTYANIQYRIYDLTHSAWIYSNGEEYI